MKGKKKENAYLVKCLCFATVLLYALCAAAVIFSQEKEINSLKGRVGTYSGDTFATIQIWNETSGKWDTYQGSLDFDSGLHGEWAYEVMGQTAVLTGARLIGSVEPDGKTDPGGATAEEGFVEIYTGTGEKYTFYGTVVTPSVPLAGDEISGVVFYMPIAELKEFVSIYEGGFEHEE